MNDSLDYWFKTVAMLQNNWSLIDRQPDGTVVVSFINDASGLFDSLSFNTLNEAESGLKRNGFKRFADDLDAQKFISPPKTPFQPAQHPNGTIYSSGEYWN